MNKSRASLITSGSAAAMLCFAITVAAWVISATPCLGLPQWVPSKIADLKTGVSQAELMKRLGEEGKITTEPSKDKRGPTVTWSLPDNPYYENVSFRFTEKDRLFLIRFALKSSARGQFAALKDDFFGKYDISPDKPFRLRRQDEDILLYGPNKGATLFFLEFTNTKTGKKWYEVFNRRVSGEDRPLPPPQKEEKKAEEPSGGKKASTPAEATKPAGTEPSAEKPTGEVKDQSGKSEQPATVPAQPEVKEPQADKAPEAKKDKPSPSPASSTPAVAPTTQAPQPTEGDKASK